MGQNTMFERIVVSTDFSETSLRSLRVAAGLAGALGKAGTAPKLVLVHVDEERALGAHGSADLINFMNEIDSRRKEWMESMGASLEAEGIDVELVRLEGVASEELLAFTADRPQDLLVMGALGHTSLRHVLLGSTSRAVLRQATCPVLTVGSESTIATDETWSVKRICFPTDFSPASVAGMERVAQLARGFGAGVEIMHVLRAPIHVPALPGEPPLSLPMSAIDPGRDMADADLNELADRMRAMGVEDVSTGVTLGGDAADGITSYARGNQCDLIVVPRHGRGGVRSFLFGRVAQNVVKAASVPVLTFAP